MKSLPLGGLPALVCVLLGTAGPAFAFSVPWCQAPIDCGEQTITCYRSETHCREVPCTVMKKVCREVVEMKKIVVPIPYTEMQKREIYVYKTAPEKVVRTIHVAVECPTCKSDCGCGHCCKPNPASYPKTIETVECAPKPCKVEIVEPICKVRTEEKLVPTTKVIVEEVPERVVKKEYYTVMVPYEVKVSVPVFPPGCGR